MKLKSIKAHLAPYSIYQKRRSTIKNAFASALAPKDQYDETKVSNALRDLGQLDLEQLTCVYCGKNAQTWDHLVNLVKAGELHGYGHQLGNLVPCCKDCNSAKQRKPFDSYVTALDLSPERKAELLAKLERHISLATPIDLTLTDLSRSEDVKKYFAIRQSILDLMKEADILAGSISNQKSGVPK